MARPRTISDQQIVDAAREVFLEHGFSATTAEIARRAGVSEGTLFKRFATKEELFAQTVGLHHVHDWHKEMRALIGRGDMRSNLEQVSLLIVTMARQVLPQLMMMWSRGQVPPVHFKGGHDPVSADTAVIAQYLRAEVGLGRLRPVDCEVVADALMGALTNRIHRELLQGSGIDAEYFVKTMLDFWWPGLAPPAPQDPSSKSE
ncbi:TetR/AcrR family transcriptional regulator [Deinococcus detaillensis]|uniref:TetR/AcrR family transcriptional regulator n=1 Tax=Deinococcus detaillensis TaxID=2592048 RepID=A0A553V4H2_9DEIO|nr:TetR/AcrR family transcriptional regulator [Deinococcus detaillensis]TSA87346.1 TetR/AcrR family transcriptional regulator [Deinococcus detaillensis]